MPLNKIPALLLFALSLTIVDVGHAQRARATPSPASIHQRLDLNGDGYLTRDELQGRDRLLSAFDYFDSDGDGLLSRDEFTSAIARAQGRASQQGGGSGESPGGYPAPRPGPAPLPPAAEQEQVDPTRALAVALPSKRFDSITRDLQLDGEGRALRVRLTFPLGDGPFPVILFSPYLGGLDAAYGKMADFLAGQGFVLIQLAHGDSVGSMSTGGQEAMSAWRERPQDLRFVLDHLLRIEELERRLEGKLDTGAIGVSGHLVGAFASSFLVGAQTVEGDSYLDERVDAALLLAPQGRDRLMDETSWASISQPMMVVAGSELPSRRTGNPASWRTDPFVYSNAPDKFLVFIEGMDGRFGGLFADGRSASQYQGIVSDALESYVLRGMLDFWNAYLRGDVAAQAELKAERLESDSGGVAAMSVKLAPGDGAPGAMPGDPRLVGDYSPLGGSYPVGEDRLELYDRDRRRGIPIRVFAPDAVPADGGWPVVVFSHGLGESRESYTYLGEALAANGYAVVFMTHEGSDSRAIRGGTRGLNTVDNAQQKAADVHFLIDSLIEGEVDTRLFRDRLDVSHIVAAGQCAGSSIASAMAGLTAVLPGNTPFSSPDDRIEAVVLLGPQVPIELAQPRQAGTNEGLDMLKADSWAGIELPLLVVAGERDFMWYDAVRRDPRIRIVAYDTAGSDEKYLIDLTGGGHHAFTDSKPWYPAGPRVPEHHDYIASSVVAFLDAYVRNDPAALAWLQSGQLERDDRQGVTQDFVSARQPAATVPFPGSAPGDEAVPPPASQPWDSSRYYKPDAGPYRYDVVQKLVLRDRERNKDLQVRVTYPVGTGEQHPVIVFVHGAWASNEFYQPLVQHWASHGYVILQANHRDSTALGTRVRDTSVFRDWSERPLDVHFMLDSLSEVEQRIPALAGRLDADRVGVGGHSYGAHTAQLIAGTKIIDYPSGQLMNLGDERVRAAMLLSAQGRNEQFDERAWDTLEMPVIVITGTMDPGRGGEGVNWRLDPFIFAASDEKHLLFIDGAYHDFGGATGGTLPGQPSHEDPDIVLYTRSASTAFWDAYLRDAAPARAFLMSDTMNRLSRGGAILTQSEAEGQELAEANSAPVRTRRRR
jgi:predicted dienelactone hydrolase